MLLSFNFYSCTDLSFIVVSHIYVRSNTAYSIDFLSYGIARNSVLISIIIIMAAHLPFKGKVIAITGAASGIGLATAHLLASRGASLSLADMSSEALAANASDIRTKHSVQVHEFVLDVRKTTLVDQWIQDLIKKFGKLDGAANMAGVAPRSIGVKGIAEQDEAEWEFVLGINLTGTMHCLRAQLGVISEGGSIVNAASELNYCLLRIMNYFANRNPGIAGVTGRINNGAYSASKHGVVGLTRSAAKEVGGRGVRVNSVAPGRIDTPMSTKALVTDVTSTAKEADSVALGRSGKPEEVASLIAFLLGDESRYITGATYSIDGGWYC